MKNKQKKLIIFDLDGTLINAYEAIIKSLNYTLRRLNYPKQKNQVICRAVGWGDENLLRPFIKEKDLKKALVIYRRHHKLSLVKYSHLFPKVALLLQILQKRGYKLAVASNRPTKFSWILIRHLKLRKYFDYVLCGDKLKRRKPYPDILNKIMRALCVLPQETIYVGDMTVDAQAGRNAKVETIIVTTGSSSRKEIKFERPYHIISRVWDLLKVT